MSHFIDALNQYNAIHQGEPGIYSDQERTMAALLHRLDRGGRRRRYLATTTTPSIDGYIDFVYAEQQAHSVRNGQTPSTQTKEQQ